MEKNSMNQGQASPQLASMIILSYNQEEFIRETITSAINQKIENLEVIVSDDCSSDNTYGIIEKIAQNYKGNKKLIHHKNDHNIGLTGNFNKAVSLARGKYIIVGGGDDVSLPMRSTISIAAMQRNKDISCASMAFKKINPVGKFIENDAGAIKSIKRFFNFQKKFGIDQLTDNSIKGLYGPSRIFNRDAFDLFGPLNHKCPTEDSTMLLRCLLIGNVMAIPKIGLNYRIHSNNLSSEDGLRRMNIAEILNQYKSDIKTAEDRKTICESKGIKLKKWAHDNISNRIVKLYPLDFKTEKVNPKTAFINKSIECDDWLKSMQIAATHGQHKAVQELAKDKILFNPLNWQARLALIISLIEENRNTEIKENILLLKNNHLCPSRINQLTQNITP